MTTLLALYPSVQVAAVLIGGMLLCAIGLCAVLARVTVCGVEMRRRRL